MDLDYLYFNIRSKECQMLNNNNCDLIVNMPFSLDVNENEYWEVQVISAEIPCSFYNISAELENNIFRYVKYEGGSNIEVLHTLPSANYTIDSLMSVLNEMQDDFVLTYSELFNKFEIEINLSITFIGFEYFITSYWQQIYGIVSNQLIENGTPSFFNGVANLATVHSLLVRSSLQSGNSASTSSTNNDIIQKISLDVNSNGIIIFNQNSMIRRNIVKTSINQFYLRITEQNNKTLQLNYLNWEMSLLFTKISHNFNVVSDEQLRRRENNYIPLPIEMTPPIQPQFTEPIQATQTIEPIQPIQPIQNEEVAPQETPILINNNENIQTNEENPLIKPEEDLYENLDDLLLSLVID